MQPAANSFFGHYLSDNRAEDSKEKAPLLHGAASWSIVADGGFILMMAKMVHLFRKICTQSARIDLNSIAPFH